MECAFEKQERNETDKRNKTGNYANTSELWNQEERCGCPREVCKLYEVYSTQITPAKRSENANTKKKVLYTYTGHQVRDHPRHCSTPKNINHNIRMHQGKRDKGAFEYISKYIWRRPFDRNKGNNIVKNEYKEDKWPRAQQQKRNREAIQTQRKISDDSAVKAARKATGSIWVHNSKPEQKLKDVEDYLIVVKWHQ